MTNHKNISIQIYKKNQKHAQRKEISQKILAKNSRNINKLFQNESRLCRQVHGETTENTTTRC